MSETKERRDIPERRGRRGRCEGCGEFHWSFSMRDYVTPTDAFGLFDFNPTLMFEKFVLFVF